MFFDNKGRFLTSLTSKKVIKNSRYYFSLDEKVKSKIDLKNIYNNSKKFFNTNFNLSFDEFENKIKDIKKKLNESDETKNILNGFSFPFIIPKLDSNDIGLNIQEKLIPSLTKSYKEKYPNYELQNHVKYDLKGKINCWNNTRYEKIIANSQESETIGILFPCLNEFSFPAAIEVIDKLPKNFILSGGYEIISALVGTPETLFREDKYPPLLWFSSMKNKEDSNISYHLEPYGYNLTFNQRAHLEEAAEYWWHSISVIDF